MSSDKPQLTAEQAQQMEQLMLKNCVWLVEHGNRDWDEPMWVSYSFNMFLTMCRAAGMLNSHIVIMLANIITELKVIDVEPIGDKETIH